MFDWNMWQTQKVFENEIPWKFFLVIDRQTAHRPIPPRALSLRTPVVWLDVNKELTNQLPLRHTLRSNIQIKRNNNIVEIYFNTHIC